MLSVHTPPTEKQQPSVILDLYLRKTQAGKPHDYFEVIVFEKLRFQNLFCPHESEKSAFSNSSGLKAFLKRSVFTTDYCGRED